MRLHLMNVFAQLLLVPNTPWSFSSKESFAGATQTQAGGLCIAPVRVSAFGSSGSPAGRRSLPGLLLWHGEEVLVLAAVTVPCVASGCQLVTQPALLCQALRTSASPERCQGHSPSLAAHWLASKVPVCRELCEQSCSFPPGMTDS